MKYWRMSLRVGTNGHEMWPQCFTMGIAAMTYRSIGDVDLSDFPEGEPARLWRKLESSQNGSLRRFAYGMKAGDIVYIKQGPRIVGRGTIRGPLGSRAYRFDWSTQLRTPDGYPWAHQVPVMWDLGFVEREISVGPTQTTVYELSPEQVDQIEGSEEELPGSSEGGQMRALGEESYYRESPASRAIILREHNQLSNSFCQWLEKARQISPEQERSNIDIRFRAGRQRFMAELKVCRGVGTRKSIREALGQVLEYNSYLGRTSADHWLIVLDERPEQSDIEYIRTLRARHSFPLTLGWQVPGSFRFFPGWPKVSH